jgi:hypothetical protein
LILPSILFFIRPAGNRHPRLGHPQFRVQRPLLTIQHHQLVFSRWLILSLRQIQVWKKIWFSKMLFTLISVKMWGLIVGTIVSTTLFNNGMISGGDWIIFNTTVWAMIYGMKEVFRIAERRDKLAPGALIAGIAGIRGAIRANLFGRRRTMAISKKEKVKR